MASLLERSMRPQRGGLTAGVEYFGSVGKGRNAALNLNQGASTLASADSEVLPGTGMVKAPTETGFTDTRGSTPAPGDIGGGSVQDVGSATDASGPGMTKEQAARIGLVSQGVALLGAATKDPALFMAGKSAGAAASASRGDLLPAVQLGLNVAGKGDIAGPLGVATQAYNTYNKYNDDPVNNAAVTAGLRSTLYDTALGTVPGGGVLNYGMRAATGLFGDAPTSIGDIIEYGGRGQQTFPGTSRLDAAQGQKVVENAYDPLGVNLALNGVNMSENPLAMEEARRASAYANNTGWGEARPAELQAQFDAGEQRVGGMGLDTGSYGLPTPAAASPAARAPAAETTSGGPGVGTPVALDGGDAMGPGAPGSVGRDAFEASGGGGGGGGYDFSGGWADAGGGSFDYSADSGYDFADGGMIGDMPGLTKRYMDGGPVQGGPMLAMGYAQGGMMGQMNGKPTPGMVNRQIDGMLRDPRTRQSLLARPQQLMATGELTPDEVVTMGRVAEAAIYSPELYPQLRQFVAAQGMNPLPASFDPSVIMRIMAISRALQQATPPGQVPSVGQAQMQRPDGGPGNGGYLQGPGTGRSDSIGTINETTGEPVKVANGEYVIPAHVVKAKGREFFDNLLRRYSDLPKGE